MPTDISVIKALLPVLAAGFAVQRLLEIFDPFVDRVLTKLDGKSHKAQYLSILSLIVGLVLAFKANLRILLPLNANLPEYLDYIVTGLVVSGGTEGINSILKFFSYKKEEQKVETKAVKENAMIPLPLAERSLFFGLARTASLRLTPEDSSRIPLGECQEIVVSNTPKPDEFIDDPDQKLIKLGIIGNHEIDSHRAGIVRNVEDRGFTIAPSEIKSGPAISVGVSTASVHNHAKREEGSLA